MTTKDYEAIARALASTRPATLEGSTTRPRLTETEEVWAQTMIAVDLVLANDNPRFNSTKFHAACFAERPTGPWWWKS